MASNFRIGRKGSIARMIRDALSKKKSAKLHTWPKEGGGSFQMQTFLGKKFAPRGGVKIYVIISYLLKNFSKIDYFL